MQPNNWKEDLARWIDEAASKHDFTGWSNPEAKQQLIQRLKDALDQHEAELIAREEALLRDWATTRAEEL